MQKQYLLTESQPQSGSVSAPGTGFIHHVKCLRYLVNFLLRNPDTVILNGKAVALRNGIPIHIDAAAWL